MQKNPADVVIFLAAVVLMTFLMMGFVMLILNLDSKKHQAYKYNMKQVKTYFSFFFTTSAGYFKASFLIS